MSSGRAGGGGGDRLSGTHFWSPRSGGGLPSTGQKMKGGGYTKTFANEEEVSVFEDARSEIDEIKVSKCLSLVPYGTHNQKQVNFTVPKVP